ncbi:GGDEF domain-containing protein [Methylotuvimicrobium sp. KM2]|uniref:GGDEF domain-containing protein n=1 Tax=Methylotuvimicrobium sp. KM2 TaxID=3133976 RepID=UPI003100C5F7
MVAWSRKDFDSEWKGKYFKLLHEQETADKQTQENEVLLCKTIARLTLAAKGLNHQLDPFLMRIHKTVKSGLKSAQLKIELEGLTKFSFNIGDSEMSAFNAVLLFDYLLKLYTDDKTVKVLKVLQQKFENGEFKTNDELFLALVNATEPQSIESSAALSGHADKIKTEILSQQLLLLLEDIEIPFEFEESTERLKSRLQNQSSASSFKQLLNDYVSLLVKIKNHIQSEQKDIKDFLSELTEQLTELGLQAIGANDANRQTQINRNELDRFVSTQMQELQDSSAKATTLEPLKQLIGTRIALINKEILHHRENEERARQKTERQLNELTDKIKRMESESSDLKLKLSIALDRALRDPLTGLGNRMAYDNRLELEITRWNRHKSPLTLIIWDIDHFKNINDTLGHKAGDKTLKIIAKLLSENCRHLDFLSRFGGEEFTMLLPETDQESALTLANKLRKIIEKTRFNSGNGFLTITLSCGISQFREGDTAESIFDRADKALYQAKQMGRNRCMAG